MDCNRAAKGRLKFIAGYIFLGIGGRSDSEIGIGKERNWGISKKIARPKPRNVPMKTGPYFFQAEGTNSIRMGKTSKRPINMTKDKTILLRGENMP